jgi:hypothetical protein
MVIELATALVVAVAGCGAAGVALAWLNDRRLEAIRRRTPPLDAKTILETRFAKGEINEDEYNRRMHRLLYGPPIELE